MSSSIISNRYLSGEGYSELDEIKLMLAVKVIAQVIMQGLHMLRQKILSWFYFDLVWKLITSRALVCLYETRVRK